MKLTCRNQGKTRPLDLKLLLLMLSRVSSTMVNQLPVATNSGPAYQVQQHWAKHLYDYEIAKALCNRTLQCLTPRLPSPSVGRLLSYLARTAARPLRAKMAFPWTTGLSLKRSTESHFTVLTSGYSAQLTKRFPMKQSDQGTHFVAPLMTSASWSLALC